MKFRRQACRRVSVGGRAVVVAAAAWLASTSLSSMPHGAPES